MSLATLTAVGAEQSNPSGLDQKACAVSPATDWVALRPAATVNAADNSGNAITDPNTSITTSKKLLVAGVGTGVRVRFNYKAGTATTAPVIQVFGLDANHVPERLFDSTGAHAITLARDATNDIATATDAYSVSAEIDVKGNKWVIVGIKTAHVGSNAATSTIDARVI